ncbi:hypothetical protein KJ765_05390 [Candidatus Micrarchaeota archaeon]|nr:hypothetical protein [Candidatus Micrarchaeota archaeon]
MEDERDAQDLLVAFHSAAHLLELSENYLIKADFVPFAGLKSTIRIDRGNRILSARVSDGFKAASPEALLGLALELTSKVTRRKLPDAVQPFADAYQEMFDGKEAMRLHDSLRKTRGRKRKANEKGKHVDLKTLLERVWTMYPYTFQGTLKPTVHWSRSRSRRRLAFYDSAFNAIVVSKRFDHERTPHYFIEYLLFHELLHAKHDVEYGNRKRVHHQAFKSDEKRFALYQEAQEYLKRL